MSSRWPADNQVALLKFYGTPGPEVERQLVDVVPPFKMYYEGKPVPHIKFHRKAADALSAALAEIWEHYGKDQAKVDACRISHFSGAYNPRFIRGSSTKWSNHAYGAAIDFDAEHNGFNTGHGTMPQAVIDAFKRQGARWGGNYLHRTDPMHFEFCDPGPSVVKPVGLLDEPQADGDSDSDAPTEAKSGGFFGRVRNWVVAGASSLSLGGLGALTDWKIAVVLFGALFVTGASIVAFIIFFFGAEPVREWVRKHVA